MQSGQPEQPRDLIATSSTHALDSSLDPPSPDTDAALTERRVGTVVADGRADTGSGAAGDGAGVADTGTGAARNGSEVAGAAGSDGAALGSIRTSRNRAAAAGWHEPGRTSVRKVARAQELADAADLAVFIRELRRAKDEVEIARRQFDTITDMALIDHIVFRLGAAEKRFDYLFGLAKKLGVSTDGMNWLWCEGEPRPVAAEQRDRRR